MKGHFHGHLYDSNNEVERTVRTWIKKQSVEFFHDGFEKLVHHWHKSEENSGNYVKGIIS
jgi:hypothetical protein